MLDDPDVAAMGANCPVRSAPDVSCMASGRIDGPKAAGVDSCTGDFLTAAQLSGVVCCPNSMTQCMAAASAVKETCTLVRAGASVSSMCCAPVPPRPVVTVVWTCAWAGARAGVHASA